MERHYVVTSKYEEIESLVIQNNYKAINGSIEQEILLKGIVLLSDGNVAGVVDTLSCLLRIIDIKDNEPHLSTETVGRLLNYDIDKYNSEYDNKIIYSFKF